MSNHEWFAYHDREIAERALLAELARMGINALVVRVNGVDDPRATNIATDCLKGSHLDVTGGTKAMVQAAARAWQTVNSPSETSDIWYVETQGCGAMVKSFNRTTASIKVDTGAAFNGFTPCRMSSLHGLPVVKSDNADRDHEDTAFERNVVAALRAGLPDWKIKHSLIRKTGNAGNLGWQIDGFAVRGLFTVLVECKNVGNNEGFQREAANLVRQVDLLAQRFGGDTARGVLVAHKVGASSSNRDVAKSVGVKIFDNQNLWTDAHGLVAHLKGLAYPD
jgi:hypothetical protein